MGMVDVMVAGPVTQMIVAAYQHISTAGVNISVLELVFLLFGASLALLFNGPGRFSFDAGIVPAQPIRIARQRGFCSPTGRLSTSVT